ncbi:hypothetical protein [Gracilibacillus marinus]
MTYTINNKELEQNFLERDHKNVAKEIAAYNYCAAQAINRATKGKLGEAESFWRDAFASLREISRMAEYKKNNAELHSVVNQLREAGILCDVVRRSR